MTIHSAARRLRDGAGGSADTTEGSEVRCRSSRFVLLLRPNRHHLKRTGLAPLRVPGREE
jgi:hypothetical protein